MISFVPAGLDVDLGAVPAINRRTIFFRPPRGNSMGSSTRQGFWLATLLRLVSDTVALRQIGCVRPLGADSSLAQSRRILSCAGRPGRLGGLKLELTKLSLNLGFEKTGRPGIACGSEDLLGRPVHWRHLENGSEFGLNHVQAS